MFGSDRDKRAKAGLIGAGLILALSSAGGLIAWGRLQSAEYERQAYAETRHYAENTNQQISETCLGLVTQEQLDCINEARNEQRNNERNEYDLVAQRQSALWAYVMALAAVIGMGLSVVGVFLVWITFRETRRAADAGYEANKIALATQRPWINFSINTWHFSFKDGTARIHLLVEAKNEGSAPAERVSIVPYFEPGKKSVAYIFNRVPLMFGTEQHEGWHERLMFHGEEWRYECVVEGTNISPDDTALTLVVSIRYLRPGAYGRFHYTTKVFDIVNARTLEGPLDLSQPTERPYVTAVPRETWPAACS